jgi:pimeloyl-ACP methyl ester carboxylesterase
MGSAKKSVLERVVLYPSHDQYGDTLTLSGKLCVPQDRKPKGIILLPHWTISDADEAPSHKVTGEAKYFIKDYVLVMPDYIGYGVTGNRMHPYLHGELTARNTVDMMLYCRQILDSMALGIPTDSIFIVGYSQGGATALWTLKLIEEEYAESIHVRKCFAGGSPCDVASIYDEAVRLNAASVPPEIPLLVLGTSASYGLNLKREDFLSPAMLRAYDRYIAPQDKSIIQLYFLMPNHKLTHWMTPAGMDKTQPETKRFYDGMLRSSLVHYDLDGGETDSICPEWKPRAPLYVFQSKNDRLVSYMNGAHLRRCLGERENITWDFGKYGDHMAALHVFMGKVKKMMDN